MARVSAGLEAAQVRAPFPGVDVVGEGEDLLVVSVVVLEGDLQLDAVFAAGQKDRVRMDGGLVAVQVFDEGDDAAFVEETRPFAPDEFVFQVDAHPGVEEGKLPQALGQDIVAEDRSRGRSAGPP